MKAKTILSMAWAMGLLMLFSCNKPVPVEDPTAKQEAINKAAYLAIENAFSTGNPAALDSLITADAIDHMGDSIKTGPGSAKDAMKMFRTGFPDLKMETKTIVAEGDMVIGYGWMSGTNSGTFMGMPPTGKSVRYETADIVRFKDGKAVEHWFVSDNLTMMTQMGSMPAGGKPEPKKK